MLNGLREEEAAGVGCGGLLELPQEEVLVELVEGEEGEAGEAVDDGGDDGVTDGWEKSSTNGTGVDLKGRKHTNGTEQRNTREQRTPCNIAAEGKIRTPIMKTASNPTHSSYLIPYTALGVLPKTNSLT